MGSALVEWVERDVAGGSVVDTGWLRMLLAMVGEHADV